MTLYDMMRNPDLPMQDIAVRNAMLGGTYALYVMDATDSAKDYKAPLYAEKAKMLPLFYEYIQENSKTNYAVSWSKWIEGRIN